MRGRCCCFSVPLRLGAYWHASRFTLGAFFFPMVSRGSHNRAALYDFSPLPLPLRFSESFRESDSNTDPKRRALFSLGGGCGRCAAGCSLVFTPLSAYRGLALGVLSCFPLGRPEFLLFLWGGLNSARVYSREQASKRARILETAARAAFTPLLPGLDAGRHLGRTTPSHRTVVLACTSFLLEMSLLEFNFSTGFLFSFIFFMMAAVYGAPFVEYSALKPSPAHSACRVCEKYQHSSAIAVQRCRK